MIDPRALAELDAWVAEEVAAIRAPSRSREQNVVDANRWASERGEAAAANEDGSVADRPAAESAEAASAAPAPAAGGEDADGLAYDGEEEAFMERTAQWLAGRANADILLEEIWRRIGDPSAESEDVIVPINLPQGDPEWPLGAADDRIAGDGGESGEGDEGPEPEPEDGNG